MSLSKALRFEVLRRDGFACTYCGRKPPDVELHIDHVTPEALGGQDVPENLRTSCVDCNAGKGSTPPDAELVARVSEDAARWAAAIRRAAEELAESAAVDLTWFLDAWPGYIRKPPTWESSIRRWLDLGLPREVIVQMVGVAMAKYGIPNGERFNYFAACCWRQTTAMQERAAQIIAGGSDT